MKNKTFCRGIWHINRLKKGAEITPLGVARSKAMLAQFLNMNESQDKTLALIPRETQKCRGHVSSSIQIAGVHELNIIPATLPPQATTDKQITHHEVY